MEKAVRSARSKRVLGKGVMIQEATLLQDPLVTARRYISPLLWDGIGTVASLVAATESIDNVEQVLLAPYHLAMARILNPESYLIWNLAGGGPHSGADTNGEIVRITTKKSYKVEGGVLQPGKYTILIVNAQTFFHRNSANHLVEVAQEELHDSGKDEKAYAKGFNLRSESKAYADLVLGGGSVYTPNSHEQVKVFTADAYVEAQRGSDFLRNYPSFIGVFTEEEHAKYENGEDHKNKLLDIDHLGYMQNHVPSMMLSGTESIWRRMLEKARVKKCKQDYEQFGTGLIEERFLNESGRIVHLDDWTYGFTFSGIMGSGRAISASHQALETLVCEYYKRYPS